MLDICSSFVMNGLIGALLACGMFISFKILKFFDLTACGSFLFGGFLYTQLSNSGKPILAILVPTVCGALFGSITSSIHLKFHIPKVLSGLMTSTLAFVLLYFLTPIEIGYGNVHCVYRVIMFLTGIAAISLFYKFIVSEFGLQIRAIGGSTTFSNTFTINKYGLSLIGLSISNAFIALAGAIAGTTTIFPNILSGISIFLFGTVIILSTEKRITQTIKYNVYYEFLYAIVMGSAYYIIICLLHDVLDVGTSVESISALLSILLIVIHFAEKRIISKNNKDYFWGRKDIYYE